MTKLIIGNNLSPYPLLPVTGNEWQNEWRPNQKISKSQCHFCIHHDRGNKQFFFFGSRTNHDLSTALQTLLNFWNLHFQDFSRIFSSSQHSIVCHILCVHYNVPLYKMNVSHYVIVRKKLTTNSHFIWKVYYYREISKKSPVTSTNTLNPPEPQCKLVFFRFFTL